MEATLDSHPYALQQGIDTDEARVRISPISSQYPQQINQVMTISWASELSKQTRENLTCKLPGLWQDGTFSYV